MTTVAIKINPDDLDDVRLIIKGDVPQIIKLEDSFSSYNLNYEISQMYFSVHSDDNAEHTFDIDGLPYSFSRKVWHTIMKLLDDEFLDKYFPDKVKILKTRNKKLVTDIALHFKTKKSEASKMLSKGFFVSGQYLGVVKRAVLNKKQR